MQQFVIEGGHPISGEMTPAGNKNAALKMLSACLLTDEPVTLHNMPDIGDVRVMVDLIRTLGVTVDWVDAKTVRVQANVVNTGGLDAPLSQKIRPSIVLAGPLLHRVGIIELPLPGGDAIGERRLDAHVNALQSLGVQIEYVPGKFTMHADKLTGADILLREASVTATETAILAAVLAKDITVIRNAASEPHVQNLCEMLVTMGAQIEGIGSNRLVITGMERLHGGEARVGADYLEVVSFIGAAVMTGGELRIHDADPQFLDMVALVFERLGAVWTVDGSDIFVPANQPLGIAADIGGRIPVIKAQPWPAFPADLMSIALVVATQSVGAVLFHDWMYESRFFFTDKLARMGARVTLLDPHRVLVQGRTRLMGSGNISSPDIRAGMALLLAALSAKGETRIANIQQIDRGYEGVDEKLAALGAKIIRIGANGIADESTLQALEAR